MSLSLKQEDSPVESPLAKYNIHVVLVQVLQGFTMFPHLYVHSFLKKKKKKCCLSLMFLQGLYTKLGPMFPQDCIPTTKVWPFPNAQNMLTRCIWCQSKNICIVLDLESFSARCSSPASQNVKHTWIWEVGSNWGQLMFPPQMNHSSVCWALDQDHQCSHNRNISQVPR